MTPRCSVPESVTVGSSTELRCAEIEGYPLSQYQWYRNNEELPEDPKTSIRFYNSSYVMNTETGSLVPHVYKWFPFHSISFFFFYVAQTFNYVLFVFISDQKFRVVRKEDAGEYHCQARNDAGYAKCPPQLMEVCKYPLCVKRSHGEHHQRPSLNWYTNQQ